ncbi:MAG: mercury resistance system periplasmic binding protein MerP [Xanthomonadaceae bacterium]|nr:mercury resistance system periplasmic binding protein MerP [Xanthomonadaceae bacterium]MDE1959124.1 mercury resistance system periplasmic binding protein MerP [Xanthomonadaceae bacterium]MDE2178922.1 mercury resistance system periplasmic binding protein MerP [Xanthomonadaceae bacterium]MDE2246840.1 mercury resistance system periplasmic binding protein MerP [Xanthomonadaceae bacterium]
MNKFIPAAVLALAFSAPAWAATQSVTLSVPGMTCGACPITVRTALDRVPGVKHVAIAEAARQVTVTFDDARTTPAALTRATRDAGYPSQIVKAVAAK